MSGRRSSSIIEWAEWVPGSRRSPTRCCVLWTLLVAAVTLLASGCGDEGDDGQTNAETMNAALADLGDFATDLTANPAFQMTGNAAVEDLFGRIGFRLDAVWGAGVMPLDFTAAGITRPSLTASRSRVAGGASVPFGTYERDVTSAAEPFPGWVFVSESPADGLIFHFSEDDDFVIRGGTGERHVSGEIRFLQIVLETVGVESFLTHVVWEIQVDPIALPLIHVPFAATLDETAGGYSRVAFGDVDAPNSLSNCYIGNLAFDFLLDATTEDVRTALLAVDTAPDPNYVLALDLHQWNVVDDMPEEITIVFGFGRSDDAENPGMVIAASFADFRLDPGTQEILADVSGSATHRGRLLATFAGSTAEIPVAVDTDGDGDVDGDDTCVDIDITFTDDGQTMNLCEAFSNTVRIVGVPLPRAVAGGLSCGPVCF